MILIFIIIIIINYSLNHFSVVMCYVTYRCIRRAYTSGVVSACHDSPSVEFLLRVRSLLKTRYKPLDVVETMVQQ